MNLEFLNEIEMIAEYGERLDHYFASAGTTGWGQCECETCAAWREWDHAIMLSDAHMVVRERMRAAALRHETLIRKGVLVEPTEDGIAVTFAPRKPEPMSNTRVAEIFNAIATNIPDAETVLRALERRTVHGTTKETTVEGTHLRSIFNAITNHIREGLAFEAREQAYEDQADRVEPRAITSPVPSEPAILRSLAELNETVRRMDAVLVGMAHRERERHP